MSIRYIQTNYDKLDNCNILKFLLDLTVIDLDVVKIYEHGVIYKKGDFVYLKENNIHKIYRCKVDVSSNIFIPDEWEHIMDTYDKELTGVGNLNIKEEVIIVDKNNIDNVLDNLVIPGYKPGSTIITIFIGKEIFIQGKDFIIDANGKVTFTPPIKVEIGDKIIIEIKDFISTTDKFVLLSSNGRNYEIGIIDEDVFIINTETNHSKPDVFIRDKYTDISYRIYMIDEDLYFDVVDNFITQTEITVFDENKNETIIEILDGNLVFSSKK